MRGWGKLKDFVLPITLLEVCSRNIQPGVKREDNYQCLRSETETKSHGIVAHARLVRSLNISRTLWWR